MFGKAQKAVLASFVILVILWVALHLSGLTDSIYNFLYSFAFSLVPLIGGAFGMKGSRTWGGFKSYLGKAVFFISFGLFLWGAGSMVWSYYNIVAQIEAPYPSLADIGFAPSIFFYGLGTYYLSKATGAKYGLRNKLAKFFVTVAPIAIFVFSYYMLVTVARGGVLVPEGETLLKAVLDIAYPLGDFVALTIGAIVSGLSFEYLGGKHLPDMVAFLGGLGLMYVADAVFSYTTTVGTFYNGDLGDLLFATALSLMTFGILGFYKVKEA